MLERGTRFSLFAQPPWVAGYARPETVTLSPPSGTVGAGPADGRMYVIEAIGKRYPYGLNLTPYGRPWPSFPPWEGPIATPARPDRQGHFDHLRPGDPAFELAHAYACIRVTLDVWERYLGRPIRWHFAEPAGGRARLEIALLRHFDNASAGFGFVEIGTAVDRSGAPRPFALNLDVLAHELGHLMLYAAYGDPPAGAVPSDFFGFHEATADLVALVACTHLDSVLDRLFAATRGNLYAPNELNAFGELGVHEEIRRASNARRLREFAAGWDDEHELAEPLIGAMFDILVDIYHEHLKARGLLAPELEDLLDRLEYQPAAAITVQAIFDRSFDRSPDGFRDALLEARDRLGHYLAALLGRLAPASLTYAGLVEELILIDRDATRGRFGRIIRVNALWRDIGLIPVGPRRTPPGPASHAVSARTLTPAGAATTGPLTYRERHHLARCGASSR